MKIHTLILHVKLVSRIITGHKLSVLLFLYLFLFPNINTLAQKGKKIELLHANTMKFDRSKGDDVKKLIGDVQLEHAGAYLNCDSAYLFQRDSVEAFGHVYIQQGDTLHLYGDYLNYSAGTKLAVLRNHVKLLDKETTLTTDVLDFDLEKDLGYYRNSGYIVNGENHISSIGGTFFSKQNLFHFQDSVVVTNPKYVIYSDTMKYHTETEIVTFFGPTEIIADSNYIYCERGWYDMKNDVSRFSGNAFLKNQGQEINGDSLYYDRTLGIGEAYQNVVLYDSAQKLILKGNLGYFQEKPEKSMLTDSALFIQILNEEDSLFLHADTLRSKMDITNTYKTLNAYYNVKMYSNDLQGFCDSLAYSFADSVIRFYGTPFIWSDKNQLSADSIDLYTRNRQPDRLEMYGSSFIISKEDSTYFNQIKGKTMTGYFHKGEIYKFNISGNGQSIYFAKEEEKTVGVNFAESSDIVLYLKDKKIERIKFLNQPDMKLIPKEQITQDKIKLEGFVWRQLERPKSVIDIFR
jgi:lipopolysaccharide export system protein LptA